MRQLILSLAAVFFAHTVLVADGRATPDKAGEIAALLDSCPCWANLESSETEPRNEAIRIYAKIAEYNTEDIRKGVEQYLAGVPLRAERLGYVKLPIALGAALPRQKMAKNGSPETAFALYRIVFNVPDYWPRSPNEEFESYGENTDTNLNLLWPVTRTREGRFLLTGVDIRLHSFTTGLWYFDMLGEFDRLNHRFGRRKGPILVPMPFSDGDKS